MDGHEMIPLGMMNPPGLFRSRLSAVADRNAKDPRVLQLWDFLTDTTPARRRVLPLDNQRPVRGTHRNRDRPRTRSRAATVPLSTGKKLDRGVCESPA